MYSLPLTTVSIRVQPLKAWNKIHPTKHLIPEYKINAIYWGMLPYSIIIYFKEHLRFSLYFIYVSL
jgi:hypothetical protein